MYTISKKFPFSASHELQGLPDGHPCSRLHGHNYEVTVELSAEVLNKVGFVVDYRELDCIKKWINLNVDHQHLNNFFVLNPTAENLAKIFYTIFKQMVPQVTAVIVSETPKTTARYEP